MGALVVCWTLFKVDDLAFLAQATGHVLDIEPSTHTKAGDCYSVVNDLIVSVFLAAFVSFSGGGTTSDAEHSSLTVFIYNIFHYCNH